MNRTQHSDRRYSICQRRWPNRAGLQLLELVITLSTSGILIAGVSASIFLSSRGRNLAESTRSQSQSSVAGFERLQRDIAGAKSIVSASATDIRLVVSDRDGDNSDETLHYTWDAITQQLVYSDGSSNRAVTSRLDTFEISSLETQAQSDQSANTFDPPGQYLFQGFRNRFEANLVDLDLGDDLTIPFPKTYQPGDLLVATICIRGDQKDSITTNASWTKIFEKNNGGDISVAAFYTFSPTGTSAEFTWNDRAQVHGMMAHFIPPSASASFQGFVDHAKNSTSADCKSVNGISANSLIIRLLGTDQSNVPDDATNMPDHVSIMFREQPFIGPCVGMSYRCAESPGTTGNASFELDTKSEYVTATLVFSP